MRPVAARPAVAYDPRTPMLARFLALVVLLNVVRYLAGFPLELLLLGDRMFAFMAEHEGVFRTRFTGADWATSFLYNFAMWLACAWVFHLARPALSGGDLRRSLAVFGPLFLLFASVSGVYMNHYAHPRAFYGYSVAHAAIAFLVTALGNALLYRRVLGRHARPAGAA